MRTLKHEELIKEYYETVKDKYPEIDFTRFKQICRSPFDWIKHQIRDGTLPIIMVKYLGKFTPVKRNIVAELNKQEVFFKKKITDEEYYLKKTTLLRNYLNDLANESSAEIINDLEET